MPDYDSVTNPFLFLRNGNLLYSIILFINWLMQKNNRITLKKHNVKKKNDIIQVIQKYRNRRVVKSLSPTMSASGGSLRALCIVRFGGGGTTLCRHARLQLGDGFVEVVRIDQWGARHTRADHNAHCYRRSVRPHLPPRVCRSSLRSLAQVEILETVPNREEINAFYRHYAMQLHSEREYEH